VAVEEGGFSALINIFIFVALKLMAIKEGEKQGAQRRRRKRKKRDFKEEKHTHIHTKKAFELNRCRRCPSFLSWGGVCLFLQ
jgi:hypothetical protein